MERATQLTRFVVALMVACVAGEVRAAAPMVATSPDGQLRIEFALRKAGEVADAPHYRVTFRDIKVIGYSRLAVELVGGTGLGGSCQVEAVDARSVREEYTQVTGKRRAVIAKAEELVVRLREAAAPRRTWEVVLRAFDNGVAFRYRFPKQDGWDELAVAEERTEFRFPATAKAFALPLNGFTTSYETRYESKPIEKLPKDWLLGLPLLLECPGGTWVAVTEANVNEYAGMYLSHSGNGVMSSRLSPLPKKPGVAVRSALPHVSPWRVVMIGDRVGRLVESDIVLNLNESCQIEDTAWIKTGKTTFPWWNGFYEEKVPFKPGLNTATAKHYIDFCAAAGIPYHSLDGSATPLGTADPLFPTRGLIRRRRLMAWICQRFLAMPRPEESSSVCG